MKAFLVLSAILAVGSAHVLLHHEPFIGIKSLRHDIHHTGHYNVHSEGMDGTLFAESGAAGTKTGSYSYTSPEGELVTTSYVADEGGFRVTGSHIPEMPEHIRTMLPTLPKLVEVHEEHHLLHHPVAPALVHAPTFLRHEPALPVLHHLAPAPLLVQEPAPTRTFISHNGVHIDSSPLGSVVRIGHHF